MIMEEDEQIILLYEAGRLEVDPVDGKLRCHICGRYYKGLNSHIVRRHHLPADEYRLITGLNRSTPLVCASTSELIRQAAIPHFERMRAEGKIAHFGEDPERLARVLELSRAALRERGLSLEARRHHRERTPPEQCSAAVEWLRQQSSSTVRSFTCERCGTVFEAGWRARRYCQGCQKEHERSLRQESRKRARTYRAPHVARQLSCARCGNAFPADSSSAKFCPACRPEANKERNRQNGARTRRHRAREAREVTCARCGKAFTTVWSGARYCHLCRPEAARERIAKWRVRRLQER